MDINNIGLFLRELRKEKKLTQDELSVLMNTDRTKINRLEKCKRLPNVDDLLLYSKVFDISLDELINCKRMGENGEKY